MTEWRLNYKAMDYQQVLQEIVRINSGRQVFSDKQERLAYLGTEASMKAPSVRLDPRQCPLCLGADQHRLDCVLVDREHVYIDPSQIDWPATMRLNGLG